MGMDMTMDLDKGRDDVVHLGHLPSTCQALIEPVLTRTRIVWSPTQRKQNKNNSSKERLARRAKGHGRSRRCASILFWVQFQNILPKQTVLSMAHNRDVDLVGSGMDRKWSPPLRLYFDQAEMSKNQDRVNG